MTSSHPPVLGLKARERRLSFDIKTFQIYVTGVPLRPLWLKSLAACSLKNKRRPWKAAFER
jgi:hypothetical protein